MNIAFRTLLVAAMLGCGLPALAQSGTEPVVATDLLKIHRLSEVALSPDGRQVLYALTTIVDTSSAKAAYEYRTQLYLVDGSGSFSPRQLTRGEKSATEAAWHPEGDRIAFVRQVDDKAQIFILPLLGGEAIQLTDVKGGATSPKWSPDGSKILFSSTVKETQVRELTRELPEWPSERPGRTAGDTEGVMSNVNGSVAEIRAWLDENAKDGNPRVFSRIDFLGEMEFETEPSFQHYFVIHVDSVGAEPVLVTRGYANYSGGSWISNEMIVLAGTARTDVHPDYMRDSDLFVAGSDGKEFRRFLNLPGFELGAPMVSPDRQSIAFLARDSEDPGFAEAELGIVSLSDTSQARLMTLEFDRSVSNAKWSEDGWYLYFTAASEGGIPLFRVPPFGSPASETVSDTLSADSTLTAVADTLQSTPYIERLTPVDRGIRSFDIGRATVFFIATEASNPYELYASNLAFTQETRLTSHNASWLAGKRLSIPERRALVRAGREVQFWIMKPSFFDSSRTYPLLLEIHGGPSAMWGPGEDSMWHEFQFFASRGYGVVFSNPRGSGGYGYDFRRANYRDWGEGPAGDVLAVASEVVALPWVDSTRQFITGGSYGGYLTAWIVGHDDRFKAAVAQRGVYDLGTFIGEGNAWRLVPTHFGGYPWEEEVVIGAADTMNAAPTVIDSTHIAADSLFIAADSLLIAADSVLIAADSVHIAADSVLIAADSVLIAADSLSNSAASTGVGAVIPVDKHEAARDVLIRNSPITYVEQIKTPLLIIHSDQDRRTGVAQSEVLYRSLKILGRPVEYVRYGGAGHDLSRTGDPKLRIDRILRIYEFMERYAR